MNSIRKPRRRPRVSSVSFDVFGWVLVREVAYRVLCWQQQSPSQVQRLRAQLASAPTERVALRVRRRLAWDDARRWVP